MKLLKKVGLLVTATVATVACGCMVYGYEQLEASDHSVKVEFGPYNYVDWQLSEDASFSFVAQKDENDYGGTSIIGNLSAGKSYYIRYRVAGEDMDYSEPLEVVTTPSFGNGDDVEEVACAKGTATVQYPAAKGATAYDVYVNNVKATTSTTTKATVKCTESSTVKVVPVRKCASTGFVADSGGDYITAWGVKPLSDAVKKVNYSSTGYSGINCKWDSCIGADGYEFEYANYKGKGKKVIDTGTGYGNNDATISAPKRIFYKVRARSYVKCGSKKFVSDWSPYTYVCKDLAYENVKLKAVSTTKKRRIRVSWDKVTGAKKYIVYMAKGTNAGYKKIKTTKKRSIIVSKFKKKKLALNTEYYFKVVAVGKVGKKKVKSPSDYSVSGHFYRYY